MVLLRAVVDAIVDAYLLVHAIRHERPSLQWVTVAVLVLARNTGLLEAESCHVQGAMTVLRGTHLPRWAVRARARRRGTCADMGAIGVHGGCTAHSAA